MKFLKISLLGGLSLFLAACSCQTPSTAAVHLISPSYSYLRNTSPTLVESPLSPSQKTLAIARLP